MNYKAFLSSKRTIAPVVGFDVADDEINPDLFPFQRAIVRWAARRGRAAVFADCGLGKTPMQLEWARLVCEKTGGSVLILAPLAVSQQTEREGEKFCVVVTVCREQADVRPGVNIINYERLHLFDPEAFTGIVLDESSILKAYDGKTRTTIIESFARTPYRLACTATPAPNDHMELGNHAEFLGIMTRAEMLSMFFVHDGGRTSQWRLKGHGVDSFWRWVASWAVAMGKPSDLGYDDGGFILPPLNVCGSVVESGTTPGYLIPMEAQSLQERRQARRASRSMRIDAAVDLIAREPEEKWLVWCDLNAEQDQLEEKLRARCVSIRGETEAEDRIARLEGWRNGTPVLVSKPSIFGFGLNFQHCARVIFVGLSDSYEQFYQAVRRCWRFGQERAVECHVITGEAEGAVVQNIKRKEAEAQAMRVGMIAHMKDLNAANLRGAQREEMKYRTERADGKAWTLHLGDSAEILREEPEASIDYSIFSPPFASLYTYSNSERDLGNSATMDEFVRHFEFIIHELFRVLKPGRLLSFHCMNLPTSKQHHGYIGLRDFRGDLIRAFEAAGFIFHSEVVIWKDPVTAMQRTKALGLLYKQLRKDSAMSRQGVPDYLVTMRKPGTNLEPVTKEAAEFPVDLWQRFASPVWMDINASETLQASSAREEKDEKHICPLQLEVIDRALRLWTNPGDRVLSPFAGIGSEGYVALKLNRRFLGMELKESYWKSAVMNLQKAEAEAGPDLLGLMGEG